jgi:Nif-specific regulatory protein
VLSSSDTIAVNDLTLESVGSNGRQTDSPSLLPFHESVEHFKRLRLQEAIVQAGGNKTKAAHALELQPTYLSRLCKQLGIS